MRYLQIGRHPFVEVTEKRTVTRSGSDNGADVNLPGYGRTELLSGGRRCLIPCTVVGMWQ